MNEIVARLLCLIIGYAFGLIQCAFIYGKHKGIDIRTEGSGNAGTTNALRVFGRKVGLLVFAGDCIKAIAAVLLVHFTFGRVFPELDLLLRLYAGAGVILGHNFPFYMHFKGGKGMAATAGMIIAFDWRFVIIGLILFFGSFFITHYVSLGTLLVNAGFVIEMVVFGQMGWLGEIQQAVLIEMYVITAALAAMTFIKHHANIVRLAHGEESKTYLSRKKREEQHERV